MPPCCDPLAKLTKNQIGKELARTCISLTSSWLSVLGVENRKEFPAGCGIWKLISRGGPLQFVKIGGGGTKYQEGCHIRTTSKADGCCLC